MVKYPSDLEVQGIIKIKFTHHQLTVATKAVIITNLIIFTRTVTMSDLAVTTSHSSGRTSPSSFRAINTSSVLIVVFILVRTNPKSAQCIIAVAL